MTLLKETIAKIKATDNQITQKAKDYVNRKPPQGESFQELIKRTNLFFLKKLGHKKQRIFSSLPTQESSEHFS